MEPPNGLPRYRLFTGPDDETFCRRISEAIDLGYRLYGGPALTTVDGSVIAALAVVWPGIGDEDRFTDVAVPDQAQES